jgi:hypothetical protein
LKMMSDDVREANFSAAAQITHFVRPSLRSP